MVGLYPDFFPAHMQLGWAYTQKKMYSEAIAEYREAATLSKGHSMVLAVTGYTYAVSGKTAEARKVLKDLEKLTHTEKVPPLRFAIVYAGLGEKAKAFEWLNRAYDDLDILLIYIKVNPFFDSLRNDARFVELLGKLKLAS
jgi:serine/threonine-protein kinase